MTGAANGIGRATTDLLLDRGHAVTAVDIDGDALDDLPPEVETHEVDVADEAAVARVVADAEFDAVVNCAGFQALGAVEDVDAETVERHFGTNVLGPMNLVRHALPRLRDVDGRVVNVSSLAGRVSAPFWGAYAGSKHALEGMTDALRMELRGTGVDVVLVEPGPVRTGFNEQGREALRQYLPESPYADRYRDVLEERLGGVEPERAARVIVRALEARRPKPRYTVTWVAWLGPKVKALLPTRLMDWLASRW